MRSFPVLGTWLSVCFLSLLPDSLPTAAPQVLPFFPFSFVHFFFGLFRFPSAFFRLLQLSFRLLSLLFLPFRSYRFRLTVAYPVLRFRSRFFGSPRSFPAGFPSALSRFPYLAFCWFPFVLPCFAPAAVPQAIPFQISPPGPMPDFRFLSVTSVLASHYSASVSSFPFFPFLPHSGFRGL